MIVPSPMFCVDCSFVIFGFERVSEQAGELLFSVEQMNCLHKILKDSFPHLNLMLVSILRVCSCLYCI